MVLEGGGVGAGEVYGGYAELRVMGRGLHIGCVGIYLSTIYIYGG